MRPYRAYIKAPGLMLDVVEISWYSKNVRCVIGGQYIDPSDGSTQADFDFPLYFFEEVILIESTDLKDKNGKEIYEGDILKEIEELSPKDYQKRIGVVVYEPNVASFMVLTEGGYCHLNEGKWNKGRLEYTEIIGNIHENPELLE